MSTIRFKTKLLKIKQSTVIKLPNSISAKLPSRGVTFVKGTIDNSSFQAILEPDGKGSHWFRFDKTLHGELNLVVGDEVVVELASSKDWPEPTVPNDLQRAIKNSQQAETLWREISPLARWDWTRWIASAKMSETRQRRIQVAVDKLNKGERRPCCFNRNICTDNEVSHQGVLIEPK